MADDEGSTVDDGVDKRWVCMNCGLVEGEPDGGSCEGCFEPLLDMEEWEDRDFFQAIVTQRNYRWIAISTAVALVVSSFSYVFALYPLADSAEQYHPLVATVIAVLAGHPGVVGIWLGVPLGYGSYYLLRQLMVSSEMRAGEAVLESYGDE